jgi:hypothetical protein
MINIKVSRFRSVSKTNGGFSFQTKTRAPSTGHNFNHLVKANTLYKSSTTSFIYVHLI